MTNLIQAVRLALTTPMLLLWWSFGMAVFSLSMMLPWLLLVGDENGCFGWVHIISILGGLSLSSFVFVIGFRPFFSVFLSIFEFGTSDEKVNAKTEGKVE